MNNCARPLLVTGASAGIGHATALHLAGVGYHVYTGIRKPNDGAAPRRDIGGEITSLLLDVTDADQISAAEEAVAAHVADAGLTGLVNNADSAHYLVGKASRPQALLAALPASIGDPVRRRAFQQPAPPRRSRRSRKGSASSRTSTRRGPPPARAATPDSTKDER